MYFDEDGKVSQCAWEEEDPRGIKKGPIKKSPFLGKEGGEGQYNRNPPFLFSSPHFSGKGGGKNPSFLPSSLIEPPPQDAAAGKKEEKKCPVSHLLLSLTRGRGNSTFLCETAIFQPTF